MKTNFQLEFEKHLNKFATSPYFFIGSGLSSRYINTEGWELLLENICKEINLNKNFYYYNSKSKNDLTKVAKLMAEDLFEKWWNDAQFLDSRNIFSKESVDTESPLKYEICKYFEKNAYTINQ